MSGNNQQDQQQQQQQQQNNNQGSQGNQQNQYQLFAKSNGVSLQLTPRAVRCAQGGYFSGTTLYYNETTQQGSDLVGLQIQCSTSKVLIEGYGEVDGGSYVFGQKSGKSVNAQCDGGVMIGIAGKQAQVLDVQPVCCPLNDFKDPTKWAQAPNSDGSSGNIFSSNTCQVGPTLKSQRPWANDGSQVGGYSVQTCPQTSSSSNVIQSLSIVYFEGQGIQSLGMGSCREVPLMRKESARIQKDISNQANMLDAQCVGFPVNYCTNQKWQDPDPQSRPTTPLQTSYYACEVAGSTQTGMAGVSLPGTFFESDITQDSRNFGVICDPDDEPTYGWIQIQGDNGQFLDCTKDSCSYQPQSRDANGLPPRTQWFQSMLSGLVESGASPGFCVAKDGSGNPRSLASCADLQQSQSSALSVLQGQSLKLSPVPGSNFSSDAGALNNILNQGDWNPNTVNWNNEALDETSGAIQKNVFLGQPEFCSFPGVVCNNANRVRQILVYGQEGQLSFGGSTKISAAIFAFKYLRAFGIAQATVAGQLPSLFDNGYTTNYNPIGLRSFSLAGTNVEGAIPSDWASKVTFEKNNDLRRPLSNATNRNLTTGDQPLAPNMTYFLVSDSKISGIIPPQWLKQLPKSFTSLTDSASTCLYAKDQNSQFLTDNGNSNLPKCSDQQQFKNYQVYETQVQSAQSTSFNCPFCSSSNNYKLQQGLNQMTSLQDSQTMCFVQIQGNDCQVYFTYTNNGGNDASSSLTTGNIQNFLRTQNSVSVNKIDWSSVSVDNTGTNNVNVDGNTNDRNSRTRGGGGAARQTSRSGSIAAGVIVAIIGFILLLPIIAWIYACIVEKSFIKHPRSFFAIALGTYKGIPGFFVPFIFGFRSKRNVQPKSFERGLLNKGMPANSMDLGANDVIKSDRGDQQQGYQQNQGAAIELDGVPFRDVDSGNDFFQVALAIQQNASHQGTGSINWLTNAPIFVGSGVDPDNGNKIPMFVLKPSRKGFCNRIIMKVSNCNSNSYNKSGANMRVNDVNIMQSRQILIPHLRYSNVRAVNNYNKKDVNANYNESNFDIIENKDHQVTGCIDLNLDQGLHSSGKVKNSSEFVHELVMSVDVSFENNSTSEQDQGKLTQEQEEYFSYLKSNNMFTDEEQKQEMNRLQNETSQQNVASKHYQLIVPVRYVVENPGSVIFHQRLYSLGFGRINFNKQDRDSRKLASLGQVLFFEPQSGYNPGYNIPKVKRVARSQKSYSSYRQKSNTNINRILTDTSNDNYDQYNNSPPAYDPQEKSFPNAPNYTPFNHEVSYQSEEPNKNDRNLGSAYEYLENDDYLNNTEVQFNNISYPRDITDSKNSDIHGQGNQGQTESIEYGSQDVRSRDIDLNQNQEGKKFHNILYTTQNDYSDKDTPSRYSKDINTMDSQARDVDAFKGQHLQGKLDSKNQSPLSTLNSNQNQKQGGSHIFGKLKNMGNKSDKNKGVKFYTPSDQVGQDESEGQRKGNVFSKFQKNKNQDKNNEHSYSNRSLPEFKRNEGHQQLVRDKSDYSGQSGMPLLVMNPTASNKSGSQNMSSILQQQQSLSEKNNSSYLNHQDSGTNPDTNYVSNERNTKFAGLEIPPPIISGENIQNHNNDSVSLYRDLVKTMESSKNDNDNNSYGHKYSSELSNDKTRRHSTKANPATSHNNSGKLDSNSRRQSRNLNQSVTGQSNASNKRNMKREASETLNGNISIATRNSGSLASGMKNTQQLSTYTPNDYVMSKKIEDFLSSIPVSFQPKDEDNQDFLGKTNSDINNTSPYRNDVDVQKNVDDSQRSMRASSPNLLRHSSGTIKEQRGQYTANRNSSTDAGNFQKPPLPRNESAQGHHQDNQSPLNSGNKAYESQSQDQTQDTNDMFNKYLNANTNNLGSNEVNSQLQDYSDTGNKRNYTTQGNTRSTSPLNARLDVSRQKSADSSNPKSVDYNNIPQDKQPKYAQNGYNQVHQKSAQNAGNNTRQENAASNGDWRSLKEQIDNTNNHQPSRNHQQQDNSNQNSYKQQGSKQGISLDNRTSVGKESSDLGKQIKSGQLDNRSNSAIKSPEYNPKVGTLESNDMNKSDYSQLKTLTTQDKDHKMTHSTDDFNTNANPDTQQFHDNAKYPDYYNDQFEQNGGELAQQADNQAVIQRNYEQEDNNGQEQYDQDQENLYNQGNYNYENSQVEESDIASKRDDDSPTRFKSNDVLQDRKLLRDMSGNSKGSQYNQYQNDGKVSPLDRVEEDEIDNNNIDSNGRHHNNRYTNDKVSFKSPFLDQILDPQSPQKDYSQYQDHEQSGLTNYNHWDAHNDSNYNQEKYDYNQEPDVQPEVQNKDINPAALRYDGHSKPKNTQQNKKSPNFQLQNQQYQQSFEFAQPRNSEEEEDRPQNLSQDQNQKAIFQESPYQNNNNSFMEEKSFANSNQSSNSQNMDQTESRGARKPVGSFRDIVKNMAQKKQEEAKNQDNRQNKNRNSLDNNQQVQSLNTQQTNMSFSLVNSGSQHQIDSPSHMQGVDSFNNHDLEIDLKNDMHKKQEVEKQLQKQLEKQIEARGIRTQNSSHVTSEDGTINSYDPKGVDIELELESVMSARGSLKNRLQKEIQIEQPGGQYRGGNVSTVSWRSQTPSMYDNDTVSEMSPKASRNRRGLAPSQKPPRGKARYGQIGATNSKPNFKKLKMLDNDSTLNEPQMQPEDQQNMKSDMEPVKKLIIKKPGQQSTGNSKGSNEMFMSFD